MILATLLLAILFQNAAVIPPPATLEGVVADAITGQPIPRATVQLRGTGVPVSPPPPPAGHGVLVTDTRDDGTFTFKNVPEGRYVIQAERAGYVPVLYGVRKEPSMTPTQELKAGQTLSGVRIDLTPGAVIYGRLIDDRGDVVPGATVQALKVTFKDGLREPTLVQSALTNDLGEYRLFMLYPGEYYITAAESKSPDPPLAREGSVIPLYFPGTVDPREAQTITLRAGELRGGVDFPSFPTRTRTIVGIVQGADDGKIVFLSPRNGTEFLYKNADRETGAFQFDDIVPGSYMLVARSPGARSVVPLDLHSSDELNARITLAPGFRIPVRVRIDGHPAGDDPELENLYFSVRLDPPIGSLEPDTYSPFSKGTFLLDLLDRDYRVEIARTEDYYVKSMTLNGVDVLNRGLRVTSSSEDPLEIVAAEDFGSIEGQFQGSGTVTVVLVPDSIRRAQRALYKTTQVRGAGVFRFSNVPPGDYKLFVWTEENGGPWLDPDYLRKYEDRGIAIRVDSEKPTILDRPLHALDQ